jgi:hypothetical protein
LRLHLIR